MRSSRRSCPGSTPRSRASAARRNDASGKSYRVKRTSPASVDYRADPRAFNFHVDRVFFRACDTFSMATLFSNTFQRTLATDTSKEGRRFVLGALVGVSPGL